MIAALVQARMSSRRLPGKSLLPLGGRPALRYLLDRLERAERLDLVVVATSTDPTDDPLAAFCREEGVECHRGPLEDVAARFGEAVDRYELDAFVRISGDSPMLDQQLVDHAVDRFHDVPVITNVRPRSFPQGQSVEVVDAPTFLAALAQMSEAADREHVTPYLYRHVRYANFAAPEDCSDVRLVLDTQEDADRIAAMLATLERPHWEYRYDELVRLARGI
jgi:spore coat polysaccharide biosynthesis protein SpsF